MAIALTLVACGGSKGAPEPATSPEKKAFEVPASVVSSIETLIESHKASAVGIGIIEDGELVWTRYFGEQSPGVPASKTTMFNTASVAKAVTTETVLRLVEQGKVDLDESISAHYVHPHLKDDPRHRRLTPRLILTHRTGLLNWPHVYDDGRLAFTRDPGTGYSYSGIGFDILARFLQAKLKTPFPQIVKQQVFEPLGIKRASVVQETWMAPLQVRPVNPDGTFKSNVGLALGYWNAADDLYVTVEDYARFLIAVLEDKGVGPTLAAERKRVQTDLTADKIWGCGPGLPTCPQPFGHGLGWFVFGYGENINLQHGGNDSSEAAIGYLELTRRDGMVVFINAPAPQGVLLWPKIVDLLDSEQQFTEVFHHVIRRFLSGAKKR